MNEVVLFPTAKADYRQALAWYQGKSDQVAAQFETALEDALQAIEQSPERWTPYDDRHRFYELGRFPYIVIYRIEGERSLVVAIAHTSRSDTFWRGRR